MLGVRLPQTLLGTITANWKLSVIKYLQQIPQSGCLSVPVCLYWNYARLLRSTSKEFCSFDAMLCYNVCMNQRGLVFRISTKMGTSVHRVDSFPLHLPQCNSHAPQFVHNASGFRHRPTSFHASGVYHNRKLQYPQSPISKAASTGSARTLAPFFSKAKVQLLSQILFAAVQSRWK